MCGCPLDSSDAGAGGDGRRARLPLPRRSRPIALVAVVVLVAGVSLPRLADLAPFQAAVEDVEVAAPSRPTDEALLLGERDPEQADRLRDLVDPRRLRCEPEPCELWRLRSGPLEPQAVRLRGDRLAFVDGDDVVLLDVASGDEVLRASLPPSDERSASTGGRPPVWGATPLDTGVGVVAAQRVRVLEADGTLRWERAVPLAESGSVSVVGGNLLLETVEPNNWGWTVRLFDAGSGDVLFEHAGLSYLHPADDDEVLVLSDELGFRLGPTVAVAASTGDVLWRRDVLVSTAPIWPMHLGDQVLYRREPAGWYETPQEGASGGRDEDATDAGDDPFVDALRDLEPSELVDLRTGRTLRSFDGPVVAGAGTGGTRVVATATPVDAAKLWGLSEGQDEATAQLHVLDDDGGDRAVHELVLPLEHGCCFDVTVHGGRVVVAHAGGRWHVEEDGALVPVPGEARTPLDDWLDPSSGLIHSWQHEVLTLRSPSGGSVELSSQEVWVVGAHGDVAVVATPRELLAVRLQPDGR